jgi:imidazolonepropionase-like amidohydrolase
LQAPELLYQDPDLVANVPAAVRKELYFTIRVLRLPGVARLLLRQPDPMQQWERWYEHSLRNTEKLYRAGVPLIFGTDTPFALGNFFHSVMNEVRALRLAGLPNEAILRMATSDAAAALGISDRVGTIEPGKLADLVLLGGDPVSDIEALGRGELVMKEGRIVYRRDPNARRIQ